MLQGVVGLTQDGVVSKFSESPSEGRNSNPFGFLSYDKHEDDVLLLLETSVDLSTWRITNYFYQDSWAANLPGILFGH